MKVLWVNTGIVATSLFKVDVPSSSKCVRFGTKHPRPKPYDEVKSQEVFGPACLALREDLGHGKILQVQVISDHIVQECRAFEIMPPSFEGFKNCK